MPVPYHLDESDSDSIVSSEFSSPLVNFYFSRNLFTSRIASRIGDIHEIYIQNLCLSRSSHRVYDFNFLPRVLFFNTNSRKITFFGIFPFFLNRS